MDSASSGRLRRVGGGIGALFVAGLLVLVGSASPAFAASANRDNDDGRHRASLEDVREATEKFRNVAVAVKAGYAKFETCTAQPGQGGMGQHFVNGTLAGTPAVDPLRPEAMVYQPLPGGKYRLVAIEYIAFQAGWDAIHSSPPRLFGHTFVLNTAPNRFGIPAFYELHVWLYKHNPSGMFFEWNPLVRCPPGT